MSDDINKVRNDGPPPSLIAQPKGVCCRYCQGEIELRNTNRGGGFARVEPHCKRHGTLRPNEMATVWR